MRPERAFNRVFQGRGICGITHRLQELKVPGELMTRRALPTIGAMLLMIMSVRGDDLPPAPQPPEAVKALALDLLKSLVETNTTHAHGSTAAAEQIAARLRTAGFAPE